MGECSHSFHMVSKVVPVEGKGCKRQRAYARGVALHYRLGWSGAESGEVSNVSTRYVVANLRSTIS
jgi:hypothetical protein